MFWNSTKTVRVELLTPITLPGSSSDKSPTATSTNAVPVAYPAPVGPNARSDLAFKLINYVALGVQAALIAYGYTVLAGYYNQFGIEIGELDLGIPTLLLDGYLYAFTGAMSTVNRIPLFGQYIPGVTFIAIALPLVFLVMRGAKAQTIVFLSCWVGFVSLIAFIAPALGLQQGMNKAHVDFAEYTGQEVTTGLSNTLSLLTDKGEKLSGHLILADTKSTFLLIGKTVYKIDNATNRVMRETVLTKKEASKDLSSK